MGSPCSLQTGGILPHFHKNGMGRLPHFDKGRAPPPPPTPTQKVEEHLTAESYH